MSRALRPLGTWSIAAALALALAVPPAAAIEPPRDPRPVDPRACVAERMPRALSFPAGAPWPAALREAIDAEVAAWPDGPEALREALADASVDADDGPGGFDPTLVSLRRAIALRLYRDAGLQACGDRMLGEARVLQALDRALVARCPAGDQEACASIEGLHAGAYDTRAALFQLRAWVLDPGP